MAPEATNRPGTGSALGAERVVEVLVLHRNDGFEDVLEHFRR